MLVVATSIVGIPTLLTVEPNLPLYTAANTICDLLSDASDPFRAQYARLLAQNISVSTSIDYGQEDRVNLFQENSPLRCVLITQEDLLRQLCHSYSHLSAFVKKVRLAFNDESQQGGKGFTVIEANLPCSCLQCLTGDQEQTKAGTGGEKLQEALVDQLAHKAMRFLGGSKPHLSSSMLSSLFKALRTAQVSNLPSDRDSPFDLGKQGDQKLDDKSSSKWGEKLKDFRMVRREALASFTLLLSWLKGTPPGINPSSYQQKKERKAPALNVQPRLPAESRSRIPPPGPAPSLFECELDFPHPIGAPLKGKGKGQGKGKDKGKREGKRKGKDTLPEVSLSDSLR